MRKPWQRLLWLKQAYPDNYTDPAFLNEVAQLQEALSKPQKTSSYAQVVIDFSLFYHRILNTGLMYVAFTLLHFYHFDPTYFTIGLTSFAFLIAIVYHYITVQIKSSLIIIFTMLILSPVLKSLSKTTSSDSIWTISCWLTAFYVLSIFLHTDSITSTNILVANVAVLASRLESTTDVFCFLLICIEINILLPYVEQSLLARNYNLIYVISFCLDNLIAYYFVARCLGWYYVFIFGVSAITFVLVLPRYFIYWQRNYYKSDPFLCRWDAKKSILD
ncbi:LAQU0S16e02410g1_1 [Lachancea quebecensis]|uniref:LAQU0S16e02410g1_1 n=1 Tax=Lachancea quebecensis TaxID=1654605 RepID=A0A0P1L409_9SACH|nr:LAQU0S16e02410g1_1 [Lachancea quebecensis]